VQIGHRLLVGRPGFLELPRAPAGQRLLLCRGLLQSGQFTGKRVALPGGCRGSRLVLVAGAFEITTLLLEAVDERLRRAGVAGALLRQLPRGGQLAL
jgi:hypothetical protein